MKWLDGIIDSMDINISKLWELVKDSLACCSPQGHRVRHILATKQQHSTSKLYLWVGIQLGMASVGFRMVIYSLCKNALQGGHPADKAHRGQLGQVHTATERPSQDNAQF